jgi:CubicO group peptidase (beta-lactamase class C family)
MIAVTSPETVGLSAARLSYIPEHFNRYVDDGKIPGYLVLIARRGKVAYLHRYGFRDVEAGHPVEEDTIFRIYSMTKPITTIGVLMLYERGLLQLDDPVSEFIPAFKHLEVFESGDAENYQTVPAEREVTIRDLLTHTAGFTYGFMHAHPVDAMYRQRELVGDNRSDMSLQAMVGHLSELPLLFSPGTRWSYSHATDILGYLIQEISGKALDHYFAEQILEPLGMADTAFTVSADKVARFAAGYERDGDGFRVDDKPGESLYLKQAKLLAGGGGLVSTGHDYLRFSQMLLNKGQLDGVHLLGRKTVELMTSNHLPQNGDLTSMGYTSYSDTRRDGIGIGGLGARFNLRLGGVRTETRADGIGFGFGGSVLLNPATAHILGSPGEYSWSGAAGTAFFVDPVEEMTVIFLTQLRPSWSYPIRRELRVLTYQAIVD